MQKGFTLVELILVMSFFMLTYGLIGFNFISAKQRTGLTSQVSLLSSDFKNQQLKAMTVDSGGSGTSQNYGIYFENGRYTLFRGSVYSGVNATNFTVNLGDNQQFSAINLPSSQIIFASVSGEIIGYNSGLNTVTLKDSITNVQKTITVNRYGIITGIN